MCPKHSWNLKKASTFFPKGWLGQGGKLIRPVYAMDESMVALGSLRRGKILELYFRGILLPRYLF